MLSMFGIGLFAGGYSLNSWDVHLLGLLLALAGPALMAAAMAIVAGLLAGRQHEDRGTAPATTRQLTAFAQGALLAAPLVASMLWFGVVSFFQLPSILHRRCPPRLAGSIDHVPAGWLLPTVLLAVFLLSGREALGWPRAARAAVVGAGGLWYVWVVSHGAHMTPHLLGASGIVGLAYWFPPLAMGLASAFLCPPVAAAIGLAGRRVWARRLGEALAASCALLAAHGLLLSMVAEWPVLPHKTFGLEPRTLRALLLGGFGLAALLFGWAWRFLAREDVKQLFGDA
jgi:hypothetical protein